MHLTKIISICIVLGAISFVGRCQSDTVTPTLIKVNGVSLVAIDKELDSTHVLPMKNIGSNWVAIIPYAYMPAVSTPEIHFNAKWQWQGERTEGARLHVKKIHEQNVSVMLKPQIWVEHGAYTGTIMMKNAEDWQLLEENYAKYIMAFAQMAEEENVEMLCIGTELKIFAEYDEEYWRRLIKEIRVIYSGKLTYAANWDDFDKVKFWDALDYIGVDAYFPISKQGKSKLKHLKKGWLPHMAIMDSVANSLNKQILFTEYGYRSIKDCAAKPWDYSNEAKVNQEAQEVALEALYQSIWANEIYAGGFLWKWYPDHLNAGGKTNSMFTVQNKGAADVVRKYYMR
ncbi:MAG: hypothetical protein ACI837_000115 [Crocinitomicaceae bacterium]